jgi:hypothetical protein
MSIFQTAYDTRICRGAKLARFHDPIRRAYILGDIGFSPAHGVYTIERDAASLNEIPGFSHPMAVEVDGELRVFVDLRGYGKWSRQSDSFQVRSGAAGDQRMAMSRGALNVVWLNKPVSIMRDVSPLTTRIFSSWLSEAITRRFGLDPREQLELAILAGLHYQYLFVAEAPDQVQEMKMMATVSKACNCSADDVKRVMNMVPEGFGEIDAFCRSAQDVTGSVRLKDFTPPVLYTALGGSWFAGAGGAAELIAVALEHPPTWIVILYTALVERGYKNTSIAKLAERANSKVAEDFKRSLVAVASLAVPD